MRGLNFNRRRWLSIFVAVAVALGSFGISQARAEATEEALGKARELMDLSGAARMFEQVTTMISAQMGRIIEQANPGEGPAVNELLQTKMLPKLKERTPEILEEIAGLYAVHFSIDELQQLVDFYKSPIGQKLVQEQPQLMNESMKLGQRWGLAVATEVLREMEPDFRQRGLKMPNI